MKLTRIFWAALLPALAFGCGSGTSSQQNSGKDGGMMGEGGGGTDASGPAVNSVPMVVNNGPPEAGGSQDVPFISVTLCVPGTTQCQTIDYVSVDTGSTGLRIVSSVLSKTLALPQAKATTGDGLAECYTFGDGYVWGSVNMADVKIGDEVAKNIPLQIMGDPSVPKVPSGCVNTGGPSEDTVPDFGAYGIIGINQLVPDCGDFCTDASKPETGAYYSCNGSDCNPVAVANADQLSNPIVYFGRDSNGSILQFPSIPPAGAKTLTGSLVFGIGTTKNNGLASGAKVLTIDEYGNFTTLYKGHTWDQSYIDSGTNALSFTDSSITECPGTDLEGYYCPTSTESLMAENKGLNDVASTVTFSVANSKTLFENPSYSAFDDLAGTGSPGSFAWGFPFFIGRDVYIAIQDATTPGGKGPYVAY
jgi:Protein of unknown function (DUF3443)